VDLYKAIRELVEEKKRIDRIIASLEAMLKKGTTTTTAAAGRAAAKAVTAKRRGRKSMSPEERRLVSERMARYWAAKRGETGGEKEPAADDQVDELSANPPSIS
jgi:hypothetical protein